MDQLSRENNRKQFDFRNVVCDMGMITSANGSSYVEIGSTKVISSIHGPRAIPARGSIFSDKGQFECDFRYAPYISVDSVDSHSSAGVTAVEKHFSQLVADAIEPTLRLSRYPKSLISAHVLVLQNGGGALAAAVTCVSLALTDAGVEQTDLVTAVQVGCLSPSDDGDHPSITSSYCVLDPSTSEERLSVGRLTACHVSSDAVTQLYSEGRIDPVVFKEMRVIATVGNRFLRCVVEKAVREKVKVRCGGEREE
mmetsp:Transcript_722/g.730  ORF Transcript_722/g.730 Transcript_722/m.730 type:complete len:253 (-) Transcript_722:127-885(-)